MANQINTGWWIGYVEQKEKIYFLDRKSTRLNSSHT